MVRVVSTLAGHGLEMVAAKGKTWFRELDHHGEVTRKGLKMFRARIWRKGALFTSWATLKD